MRTKILLSVCCCIYACSVVAQATDSLLPYQLYPRLPAFNIRLMDSVTIFNTFNIPSGKKTILLYFSPDCSHCQKFVKKLTNGMRRFKDVQFYMVTPVHSMTDLRNFYATYHLGDYKNIQAVGRDYEYFFGSYYGIKSVPDIVLYDGHKKLIKLFEGDISLDELRKYTH